MSFVGVKIIGKNVVPKHKVGLDLHAAFKVYGDAKQYYCTVVRLTAKRFFLREGLLNPNATPDLAVPLEGIRRSESLDFINIFDTTGILLVRGSHPECTEPLHVAKAVIDHVLKTGKAVCSTEILSSDELRCEGDELLARAALYLGKGTNSRQQPRGLALLCAAPIIDEKGKIHGVLCGGKLLNSSFDIIEKIVQLVYEDEKFNGKDVCVATIFMEKERIATNVKNDEGFNIVGSTIPEEIYSEVLAGNTVVNRRVMVANHYYLAAYGPIKNISDEVVGVLGVGLLEEKIRNMQFNAFIIFSIISICGLILSISLSRLLAGRIMRPINSLLSAAKKISRGSYDMNVNLDNAPEEIAALGDEFNRMITSIKERDRKLQDRAQQEVMRSERLAMVGQLAAGVAHEINNPLGSILLFSRLLLQKAPAEGLMRDNLLRIEKETKRCQNIVQGLLEFSRQREPKKEYVDVNTLLEKTLALFENQAMFHNIPIRKKLQVDLPAVVADPAQLQQVFVNIIINAVDAMDGKGLLGVETRCLKDQQQVEIAFSDSGCGIPEELINKIFEPFYTTKGVGHGTGLGLSISHGIIQGHGGVIRVESATGKGTTFRIGIPLAFSGTEKSES